MSKGLSIDDLWNCASPCGGGLPSDPSLGKTANRYLEHAIAPGTPPASAVRLKMHGEIKLRRWLPFSAEQVIRQDRGMIWRATVRRNGIPIRGSDRMIDGVGSMQWKLFGIFPVMQASGSDITRSVVGRIQIESIWLPSALRQADVKWRESDRAHASAVFTTYGESAELNLDLLDSGAVRAVCLARWGDPEGAGFHLANFGGIVEEEGTFDGYTIPTRLRVGWDFGTPRFESEGEFFRAVVDRAEYR